MKILTFLIGYTHKVNICGYYCLSEDILHIVHNHDLHNRAAVSRNRYGVEKTVDTHKLLINAITFYVCLQEI
jgi:hypothetical protein